MALNRFERLSMILLRMIQQRSKWDRHTCDILQTGNQMELKKWCPTSHWEISLILMSQVDRRRTSEIIKASSPLPGLAWYCQTICLILQGDIDHPTISTTSVCFHLPIFLQAAMLGRAWPPKWSRIKFARSVWISWVVEQSANGIKKVL
jgi:hypothetical protein